MLQYENYEIYWGQLLPVTAPSHGTTITGFQARWAAWSTVVVSPCWGTSAVSTTDDGDRAD
jgi:hypothetical protein